MLHSLRDRSLIDAIAPSQGCLGPLAGSIQSQGFFPLRISDLGIGIPLAAWCPFGMDPQAMSLSAGKPFRMRDIAIAPFLYTIQHVGRLCTKPEVPWGDTQFIVSGRAIMQDLQSFLWPCSRFQKPARDVCCCGDQFPLFKDLELSIPTVQDACLPQPTTRS